MELLDQITARFEPRRRDDLRKGAEAWIGRTTVWEAYWIIEEGPYEGEWAMCPPPEEKAPFAWAPSGDLVLADEGVRP